MEERTMFQHILIPTDGSDVAQRATVRGCELAARLGARVTVMTALEHFPAHIMASAYRPADEPQELPGLSAAEARLAEAEALARAAGVACARLLAREPQPVYRAILQAAENCGADLIVMGTHGMGLMERIFVGSQTQRVLAHTQIPVLTFH